MGRAVFVFGEEEKKKRKRINAEFAEDTESAEEGKKLPQR
jgi:hypothetical protein